MKKIAAIAMIGLCAGCLAPAPQAPTSWCIDGDTALSASLVTVASPYDGQRFVVLRTDGSMAFDCYNSFLTRPALLVRAVVKNDPDAPELFVRRLALDCTKQGERKAIVELAMAKKDKSSAKAFAAVDAADGNYTKAFSAAFAKAAEKLESELKR